jgi:dienelactone hydrolase
MRALVTLSCACAGAMLCACSSAPLIAWSTDTPPLVLANAAQAGVADERARFREIFCAVLAAHGAALPDYRPCDVALTRVGTEPVPTSRPVGLEPSSRGLVAVFVGGIGYECVHAWLEPAGTVERHLAQNGYGLRSVKVDGLSSSAHNARQIRDALLAMNEEPGGPRLVLIGYSKGAPDILEAVTAFPEIRSRVAAVVSASGTIAGSPLANDAEQYQAAMFRHFPDATCTEGDGGGVESLRTSVRRSWLAANPLPKDFPYYSLVTFPDPGHISSVLKPGYRKLSRIDGRNDGQMVFYDQVIPGSTLMGYVNADHWAIALPIARSHERIGSWFATENAYPREALAEAIMRFVEEDLSGAADPGN